ncbi:MAG: hypothetical protein CME91_10825 [Hyphomonadaceae bacterium]|nr:hypothetical protein [Hyphomonadaceae bacterium]MBA29557.1 hypothetical protein [Hyphomonadaceae bacterium]
MYQAQYRADPLISQTGNPANRIFTQGLDVMAQRLNEHQLAQLGQNRLAASFRALILIQRRDDQILHQRPCTVGGPNDHHPRQGAKQRIERSGVAPEIPADKRGWRALPAYLDVIIRRHALGRVPIGFDIDFRDHVRLLIGRNEMLCPLGQDHDLAGSQGLRLGIACSRPCPCVPLNHHMKRNDMLNMRHHDRADLVH